MAHRGAHHQAQEAMGEMGEHHQSRGRRLDPTFLSPTPQHRRAPLAAAACRAPTTSDQEAVGEMGEPHQCRGECRALVASCQTLVLCCYSMIVNRVKGIVPPPWWSAMSSLSRATTSSSLGFDIPEAVMRSCPPQASHALDSPLRPF
jgi:hypothetical protein